MPAPHVFALAHTQLDDLAIPDTTTGKPRREELRGKRKASEVANETENEDDHGDAFDAARLSRDTTAFVSLTAHEHLQRRAAGLPPSEPIPGTPFPHQRPADRGYIFRDVRAELQDFAPPLPHLDIQVYAPQPFKTNKERTTLREQHVAVLTTLLHTMLQRGDYARAGRAWALLLRSGNLTRDVNIRQGVAGMDLRTHERWGVGAELLMRRRRRRGGDGRAASLFVDDRDGGEGYLDYSEEGFALAKKYYERLIVQYPSGQRRRLGAQATTFYAAMFSMWIYEVNERYKDHVPSPDGDHGEGDERSFHLQDVRAIVKRMDDIIDSPPYDKNGELLQMRGMLELWMADLSDLDAEKANATMHKAAAFFRRAQSHGIQLTEQAREITEEHTDEPEDDEVLVDEDADEDMPDADAPGD